jgi:hypothetical protein
MSDNVISHNEMCRREGVSLQRGMNFGLGGNHSVILMSVRPNAPYRDRLEDGGTSLIYGDNWGQVLQSHISRRVAGAAFMLFQPPLKK